jgi:hypothetical protein
VSTEDGSSGDNQVIDADGEGHPTLDYDTVRLPEAKGEHQGLWRLLRGQFLRLGHVAVIKEGSIQGTAYACGTLAAGDDPNTSVVAASGACMRSTTSTWPMAAPCRDPAGSIPPLPSMPGPCGSPIFLVAVVRGRAKELVRPRPRLANRTSCTQPWRPTSQSQPTRTVAPMPFTCSSRHDPKLEIRPGFFLSDIAFVTISIRLVSLILKNRRGRFGISCPAGMATAETYPATSRENGNERRISCSPFRRA